MSTASAEAGAARPRNWRRWLGWAATAAALVLAAYLLRRIHAEYGWTEIQRSLTQIPAARIAAAGAFVAASYLCLTVVDWLAVRAAGHRLAWRRCALASFTALSIGHTVGLAVLSSGAVRYRFYRRWGLRAGDVARVILFCATTIGLALASVGGIVLLVAPDLAGERIGLSAGAVRAIGALALVGPLAYVGLAAAGRGRIRVRRWTIEIPSLPVALGQVAIGPLNLACVAGALHQALAAGGKVAYLDVLSVYVVANVTALVSHVPGGLGVLESVVLALIPGSEAIGGVVLFRVAYFLVPFAIGLLVLGLSEILRRR